MSGVSGSPPLSSPAAPAVTVPVTARPEVVSLEDWEEEEVRLLAIARAAGDPTGWFDQLYAAAADGLVTLPWSRTDAHPLLAEWAGERELDGRGHRAAVIGCALGADAEFLAGAGYATTGFDVSPTAIGLARARYPQTAVDYQVADLLHPPQEWFRAFDLVAEIITVQSLPQPFRAVAIANAGRFVADGGTLFVVAAAHHDDVQLGPADPWPLTRAEIEDFAADGLTAESIEMVALPGHPDDVRWCAVFRRAA